MKHSITPRDLEALCAVSRVMLRDGRVTVRTVADEIEITRAPAHDHLRKLEKAGLIEMGIAGGLTIGSVS
jgi:GTP-sensing pleiotropic transcriptional regulator CodY